MSKKKKLHPSGVRPPKPPKTPRLEDTEEVSPSSQLSQLPPHPPEELSGPAGPSAQCSGADTELVAPSSPDEEATSVRPLQLSEQESAVILPSQNSAGRFVPQFARPRKMAPRQVEPEEELRTQAVCLEAQLEPPEAEGTCLQHSDWSPGKGDPALAPPGIFPEQGSTPRASKKPGSALRSCPPDGAAAESGPSLKDHLPSRGAEHSPDPGAPHEGAAQREADTDLTDQHVDPELQSTAADPAEHTPGGPSSGACQSSQRAPCTPAGALVITDVSTGLSEPEQRALKGAGRDRQLKLRAPGGDHSEALPRIECWAPLPGEMGVSKGEPWGEDETPCGILQGGAGSQVPVLATQDTTAGAELSSPLASEAQPEGAHTQMPVVLGDGVPSALQPQPPEGLSCPTRSSAGQLSPPAPQDVEPSWSPAGPSEQPDPAEEAGWGGPTALVFDFLPDSQMQDALDAPASQPPPEQLSPWSGLSPCQNEEERHHTLALPRSQVAAPACQAASVEDATDTVRGLVLELSNLNRLVMSTHRDLEACRRLHLRRGKLATPGPRTPGGFPGGATSECFRGARMQMYPSPQP